MAETKQPPQQQEQPERERRRRREISGPGAADFIAAPGGLDLPESDPGRGTGLVRGDALTDEDLAPHLDEPDPRTERRIEADVRTRTPEK